MPSLRIGIAGANYGAAFAAAFAQIDQVTLAAIADPDSERRQPLADSHRISSQFENAEEMIGAGQLDAVVIATPTYLHERQIGAAFDAGLHVLCAAPIGTNARELSHIVTSAGLVGKTFMGSNPLRFDPRFAKAAELVESGTLGDVFMGRASVKVASWPYDGSSWRLDRERGGGALLETGAQAIDALWFALGCPDATEAMAASYDRFSQRHASSLESVAEDAIAGFVRLRNGACLQIEAQLDADLGSSSESIELTLSGSEASLDLQTGQLLRNGSSQGYAEPFDPAASHRAEAEAFVSAVLSESETRFTGKQALSLAKIFDALLLSAKEKEAAPIKLERSLDDLFGAL
ncbi:Gfo/Idh/MocA family oxidoreductase [Pelagicoccus sp. SDUM812003]|uniref:Gfo/Idh/MocA family protein n=1 Tax=Pelagicoccus sp. SDUM812003 TaxID=3041267 RepID=UPI00280D7688|nr:Gfo/Idh/MocA family oxidoreductase [Pelagicoccus sp. SDUM812003]MDQ8202270.1 Gfo/Idh/MocA family oxidoreductase [Pelagicoccus sp. SDUM812003]